MQHHSFFITELGSNRRLALATVSRDITERKRVEEDLHQAQEELAHITRVLFLGELAASIAHEVKQPLTAIINNGNACLRWLGRQSPDLEAVREALRDIITNGQRAGEIIARICEAVKKAPIQVVSLDINQIIVEVVELTHHEVQRHKAELRINLATDLPSVSGDHIQLQQVLLNLMLNGLEALSTVLGRPRELRIHSSRTGTDEILVMVQDTGCGLNPRTLAQMFNAFYTTKPTGMGMGLSISRMIIQTYGGRLWAENNPGYGATVQFSLPTAGEHKDA